MLYEQIGEDIKTAMKAKQAEKLNALRYLKSMLIENKTSAAPKEELDVVIILSKKLKESIATYPAGHESREKIQREIDYIAAYMPQPLNEQDVLKMIEAIKAGKGTGPAVFGAVMKELSPLIKGRFEGQRATELVKKALA